MKRFLYLFLFLITVNLTVNAQTDNVTKRPAAPNTRPDTPSTRPEMPPGFRRQALLLNIESRVIVSGQVIWSELNSKVTIPGTPVGVQLVGSNVVVSAQFTPFIHPDGDVLVAQGQIWIADHNGVVTYYTSIQTIPMEFDEQIIFFPLGSSENLSPSIEIVIIVNNYENINERRNFNSNDR
jgi:hypothetical protein